MTTKTDADQERADFEAWASGQYNLNRIDGTYKSLRTLEARYVWREARAALQSQDREDAERMDFISVEANVGSSLVSDDNGKWAFTDSGVAPVVANGQGFTETVGITAIVDPAMWKDSPREAIDHARRVEGEGE